MLILLHMHTAKDKHTAIVFTIQSQQGGEHTLGIGDSHDELYIQRRCESAWQLTCNSVGMSTQICFPSPLLESRMAALAAEMSIVAAVQALSN
jgi:hypothetical protein